MIPPISPSVRENNPRFALLYTHLTTNLLDDDGSTRSRNLEHESVANRLRDYHLQAAKEAFLRESLNEIAETSVGEQKFSASTTQIIDAIAAYVSEAPLFDLTDQDHEIMNAEVNKFRQILPQIAQELSHHLQTRHDLALQLAAQGTGTHKNVHNTQRVASRPQQQHHRQTLESAIEDLLAKRQRRDPTVLTDTLVRALEVRSDILTTAISHLERHTHGIRSRHHRAHAEQLVAVASALSLKTRVMYLQAWRETYPPEMQRALLRYARHLDEVDAQLRERQEALRGICDEYDGVDLGDDHDDDGTGGREGNGGGGEEVMREISRTYAQTLKEIEDVKQDIEKIERNINNQV